jgi:cell division protease FtsH
LAWLQPEYTLTAQYRKWSDVKRFAWFIRRHWWKLIAIAAAVYFAVQWLLSGSLTGSKNMSLGELQDNIDHGLVKQAVFHAADHELKATLADGSTRTVIYPIEYDDELTRLLLDKNVPVTAENPGFFKEHETLFLVGGLVVLLIIVQLAAIRLKSRILAYSKRVSDVPGERFSDVLGADEQIAELAQLTDYIRNPEKYEKAGVRMPRGWLFSGPPGTGKTLLARALAGEAGVSFYAYSGSDFAASLVGEGATRVQEMFKAARNAASFNQTVIILIDEIDGVGTKRDDRSHASSVEILNQLLVELDGFLSAGRVVVIGATNRKDVLDPALLRPGRLSRHLFLPEPALPVRRAMLERYAGNLSHLAPGISFDRLAKRTVGMSGAEIAEICNSAGLRALRDGEDTPVTIRYFELAIADHIAGQERPNAIVHEEDRVIAAVHEAGHALAGLLIDKAPKPDEVTIVPRGQSGGATWMVPEERMCPDVDIIKAHLAVFMGSRAAEKIMFDTNFSTGAAHDIQQASQLARNAICEAGMGNFYDWVPADKWLDHPNADQIATEVEQWLRDAEEWATTLLQAQQPTLEAIRDRLLEVETITGDELRAISAPALV